MANGPGVSWATGGAGALNSELTDHASIPTPPETAGDMTPDIPCAGASETEAAPSTSDLCEGPVVGKLADVPNRSEAADQAMPAPMRHPDDSHPDVRHSAAESKLPAERVEMGQTAADPSVQTAAPGGRDASTTGNTPLCEETVRGTPPASKDGSSSVGAGVGGPGKLTDSIRASVDDINTAIAGGTSFADSGGSSSITGARICGGNTGHPGRTESDATALVGDVSVTTAGGGSNTGGPAGGSGGAGASGGPGGGGGAAPPLLSVEPSSSMLEHVSREVIRKLRLAASAGSAEDRHVVCEELFADITCALDASAQAALLGPGVGAAAEAEAAAEAATGAEAPVGGAAGGPGGPGGEAAVAGRRGRARGRMYYEVLAVYYASRVAADSARALLHLCQLLWDTPWVAPIYALLLHRFLLLPRDTAVSSPTTKAAAAAATAGGGGGARHMYGMSYSDPRVKHLNVLAHGARQLMLGDVHSGLSRFQPLWAFLAFEVVGLAPSAAVPAAEGANGGGSDGGAAATGLSGSATVAAAAAVAAALPPVTTIDDVPVAARPWLLAVAAAFLPYYCLEEQVSGLARRFPPPMPMERGPGGLLSGGAGGGQEAASLAGLDFLVVEVTDVLGRINSEAGLLQYLRALRALARPPLPLPPPPSRAPLPAAAVFPQSHHSAETAAQPEASPASSDGAGSVAVTAHGRGLRHRPNAAAATTARQPGAQAPAPPLAGLPSITKLRLQSELYSLTSGGGPRYAPAEVRRAAFAALDALFPGGRSLRWFVRWASRTLHLEWLESDVSSDDPWATRGWLGWIYWPIHWCTALYGKLLLFIFQLIYGIVVWRPLRRSAVPEAAGGVVGTGGVITSEGGGSGADLRMLGVAMPAAALAGGAAGAEATAVAMSRTDAMGSRAKAGPWWQPRLRSHGSRLEE